MPQVQPQEWRCAPSPWVGLRVQPWRRHFWMDFSKQLPVPLTARLLHSHYSADFPKAALQRPTETRMATDVSWHQDTSQPTGALKQLKVAPPPTSAPS